MLTRLLTAKRFTLAGQLRHGELLNNNIYFYAGALEMRAPVIVIPLLINGLEHNDLCRLMKTHVIY